MAESLRIILLKEYEELFNKYWRYIVYYGGRYGAKSYHVALALLIRGCSERLRILCTREIQNTIKDSVHKLLSDLTGKHNIRGYYITDDSIKNTKTGTEFLFKGLKGNKDGIKSFEGIDIVWVEEGQSVSDDSLDVLIPTIRKSGSQIIITFNRIREHDPVYERFVKNPPPKTFSAFYNYDILEGTGFLSDEIKSEIEYCQKVKPELFKHIYLGEPLRASDDLDRIIQYKELVNCINNEVKDIKVKFIVCDPASGSEDGDETVIDIFEGKTLKSQLVDKKYDEMQTVGRLVNYRKTENAVGIGIDSCGIGSPMAKRLMELKENVFEINSAESPLNKTLNYKNIRSEMWDNANNVIRTKRTCIIDDEKLKEQLTAVKWQTIESSGKLLVESKKDLKKRLGYSPDRADCYVMGLYAYNYFTNTNKITANEKVDNRVSILPNLIFKRVKGNFDWYED